jgi:hypothetical protein
MSGILGRIAALFTASKALPGQLSREAGKLRALQDLPVVTKADRTVAKLCREALHVHAGRYDAIKLSGLESWKGLKAAPAEEQLAVAMAAMVELPPGCRYDWQVKETRRAIGSQLLRRPLPFSGKQLAGLVTRWSKERYGLQDGLPGLPILGAVERHLDGARPSGELEQALRRLSRRVDRRGLTVFETNVAGRLHKLLEPATSVALELPRGGFAEAASAFLDSLPPDRRPPWQALLAHASKAGGKSQPSARWLSAAGPLIDPVGPDAFREQLSAWMEATTPDPSCPDLSLDVLKGVIWAAATLGDDQAAGAVGRFAEKCFRKVSGYGPRSAKLGNACLWALSAMPDAPYAAAELFRLQTRLRLPSTLRILDSRLFELAESTGTSVEEMEDVALPDFGLDGDGRAATNLGDSTATITVGANGTALSWEAGGRAVNSAPAAVRRDHKDGLALLRQQLKDVEAARAAQVARLEQSWQEERSWPIVRWRSAFVDHPLRRRIAAALLWRIETDRGAVVGLLRGDGLQDAAGEEIALPEEGRVTLWHPLDSDEATVLAWRERILDLGITQPIKQAHREIYVLTDAERETGTYSNRFAAHILRQHQFRALCQARGWRYQLMGAWDGWNVPHRPLPHHGLTVEYIVEAINDGELSESYVPLHVATDQVRFVDSSGEPVELAGVSPILFSECLRDVDLFVAVTSVANDPHWSDGGPEGRHGGYWADYAFGTLSQTAETRRQLIESLAPRLAIADRLEVTEKFLVVRGKRQKYAIHFGSSNIQILPSKRYLCIVPDRSPRGLEKVSLPFAGDSLLSIILSKAFLLADEDQIKDKSILAQL